MLHVKLFSCAAAALKNPRGNTVYVTYLNQLIWANRSECVQRCFTPQHTKKADKMAIGLHQIYT